MWIAFVDVEKDGKDSRRCHLCVGIPKALANQGYKITKVCILVNIKTADDWFINIKE
jgi:hypothetical protein